MLINQSNLEALRTGFSSAFKGGLEEYKSQFEKIVTVVKSTQKEQKYGWLGKMPNVREWVGARVLQNIAQHDYVIELTIPVDQDDIETDNLGIYAPLFTEMGQSSGSFKDRLCFDLLKDGWNVECYDGQNFFDTDHPVLDEAGNTITVSNSGGGTSAPWFLLDVSRAIKPVILQIRKDFTFVAKDKATDDNVFNNRQYVYGTDARMNAGFGFWQMAYGSKQALTAANYAAARTALMSMKGDYGRPLAIMPRLLVVSPENESAALEILMNERNANGATNTWRGSAELLVCPWL